MADDLIALQDLDLDITFEDAEPRRNHRPGAIQPRPDAIAVAATAPARAQSAPPANRQPHSPPRRPPDPVAPVRVVALRAGLFPADASGRNPDFALERLIARLETVDADVIALQEVWRPGSAEAIGAALRQRFPHAASARPSAKGWGTGLVLLSRTPFAALYDVVVSGWWGRWRKKGPAHGLIAAEIVHGGECVRVINAQAAAGIGRQPNRRAPVRAAARAVEAHAGDCPALLVGNLTAPGGRGVAALLQTRGWRAIGAPAPLSAGPDAKAVAAAPMLFNDAGKGAAARAVNPVVDPPKRLPQPPAAGEAA